MVEGRAKQVFATLLQKRPQVWRDGIEVVAADGLSGFKSSSAKEIAETVPVMDSRSSAWPGTHWMCAGTLCSKPRSGGASEHNARCVVGAKGLPRLCLRVNGNRGSPLFHGA